jgi:hypothetical protein
VSSGSGGDGGAGARQEEEERRKAELRARIDRLYGYGAPVAPISEDQATRMFITKKTGLTRPIDAQVARTTRRKAPIAAAIAAGDIEAPRARGAMESEITKFAETPRARAALENARIAAINAAGGQEAAAARSAMEAENTKLAEATRQYYADQLGKGFEEAERKTRFRLARQGLLGGSEEVYQQGDVREDRDLGATRVDEAVRRAVASLVSQREQERLNAINLVSSGAGESAISAAQAGLRNTFANAANAQKADLFGDLFTSGANVLTAGNLADKEAAFLGRYRDRLATFFPPRSSSSGRITPSGGF